MSVYKQKGSPFYRYDFVVQRRRFFSITEARNKKDALQIEKEMKAKAIADIKQELRIGKGPLIIDIAAGRFWTEVGQFHVNRATTFSDLERLIDFFGAGKRLDEITNDDVAKMVAWRRAHTVKGRGTDRHGKLVPAIANATVNRSTTMLLRSIFSRAEGHWDYAFPRKPKWRQHLLKEPKERVRFLDDHEARALDDAFAGQHQRTNERQRKQYRDDYELWFRFARLTGLRLRETLIRWNNVNIFAKRITTIGKGGKEVHTPITPPVREILDQCQGHHPDSVFTFVCRRPRDGQVKGQRYPITAEGAKSQWRRVKARAQVVNFRFHDVRHDVATRLLRATGNLKLVQKALNHSDIKTTVKYAHVLDDEVAAALHQISTPTKIPTNTIKGLA